MKVAYNACYGGFGLSEAALIMLAELKGFDLAGLDHRYSCFANDDYSVSFSAPEDRADEDLIKVIETLGKKANGSCSKLAIKEIPEGAPYEVTEYDGYEDVEPPRMCW